MNDKDFLKDDFFVSEYIQEHENIEKIRDNQKESIKEVYAFAFATHKQGRKYTETDIINLCQTYLLNKDKVQKIFQRVAKDKHTFGIANKQPVDKTISQIMHRWDFRRNIVDEVVEYRLKGDDEFEPMNIANVKVFLEKTGNKYSMDGLKTIFASSIIQDVDVFQDYFEHLPEWDGFDHIKHVCSYIDTPDSEYLTNMLKKMMARCIRCSYDPGYSNRYVFMLSGQNQGTGKTTFVENLNPMHSKYYKIATTVRGKDFAISTAENFIINFDEMHQMNGIDLDIIKQMISTRYIKERRAYGSHEVSMMRRANFFGTTNHCDILTDTQNTRFIVIEVNDIDWHGYKDYDMDLLWAQAYHYLNDPGFSIELTSEEKAVQVKSNETFKNISIEEDLISYHVTKSEDYFTSCLEIFNKLQDQSRVKINKDKLFKIMRSMDFEPKTKKINGKKVRGYLCRLKDYTPFNN